MLLIGDELTDAHRTLLQTLISESDFDEILAAIDTGGGLPLTHFALFATRRGQGPQVAVAVGGRFSAMVWTAPPTTTEQIVDTTFAGAATTVFDHLLEGDLSTDVEDAAVRTASIEEPTQGSSTSVLTLRFDDSRVERIDSPLLIGRKPAMPTGVDHSGFRVVWIEDPQSNLSRKHVLIEPVDGGAQVTDLGSMNGTALIDTVGNQFTLRANTPQIAGAGDRLLLGSAVSLVFESEQ